MDALMEKFFEKKALAWAPATARSERSRLLSLAPHIDPAAPEKLWRALENHAPYSRVTAWVAVTAFWDFVMKREGLTGANPFREFRREYRRLFKNYYFRRPAELSYADAVARLARIECSYTRTLAEFLLKTGCRYSEAGTYDGATVVGKGAKRREVLADAAPVQYPYSASTFRRRLGAVGLKPHDLRKIHLTRRRELGADAFELQAVAGWEDLRSARSYVGVDRARLRRMSKSL